MKDKPFKKFSGIQWVITLCNILFNETLGKLSYNDYIVEKSTMEATNGFSLNFVLSNINYYNNNSSLYFVHIQHYKIIETTCLFMANVPWYLLYMTNLF